ncbi:MAG: photosystem II biogenesis protein Psp29, partial [Cyanobacteria bacterium J06628_3]
HLLGVNADFKYDPIYALGVVTTFDRLRRNLNTSSVAQKQLQLKKQLL